MNTRLVLLWGFLFLPLLITAQTCPPRPNASFRLEKNDICSNESVSVINTTDENSNSLAYIWDWGDDIKDTVPDKRSMTHFYFLLERDCERRGDFTFDVKLSTLNRNDNCDNHFISAPVYVYKAPVPQFDTLIEVCITRPTVDFNNRTCAASNKTLYNWNFGDPASGANNTSTDKNPSHTYSSVGTYVVTLSVSSVCGTSMVQHNVVITPEAVAAYNISGVPPSDCGPFEATFRNESMGYTSVYWQVSPSIGATFTSNTNQFSENPKITFSQAGTYSVTLNVYSPCGDKQITKQVTVKTAPSLDIRNITGACAPFTASPTFQFFSDGDSTVADSNIIWSFQGGNPSIFRGRTPPTIQYDTGGTFRIIANATNGCGIGRDTVTFNVSPQPTPRIVVSNIPSDNCGEFTANFNGNTSANTTAYRWTVSPNDGAIITTGNSGSRNIGITFSKKGDYIVQLEATNNCGTVSRQTPVNVKLRPTFTLQNIVDTCVPYKVTPTLLSLDDGGNALRDSQFVWSFGDGVPSSYIGRTPPEVQYSNSGNKAVTLQVGDSSTCGIQSVSESFILKAPSAAALQADNIPPDGCGPFTATFTNKSTNTEGVRWSVTPSLGWEFVENSQETDTLVKILFSEKGNYLVTLEVTNSCQNKILRYPLRVITAPKVTIDTIEALCSPFNVTPKILAFDDGGSAVADSVFIWSFAGASPNSFRGKTPPEVRYDTGGTFQIRLRTENICGIGTDSLPLSLLSPVTAAATMSGVPTSGCGPFEAIFLNQSTHQDSNEWTVTASDPTGFEFINGTSAASKDATIRFTKVGKYRVNLLVKNPMVFKK